VKDANEFFRDHSPDEFTALCAQALPVAATKASEPVTKELFDDGFSLIFPAVSYRVKLIPTFDERLRVTIKALYGGDNGSGKSFLDTVDLYSHRSRQAAINQIAKKGGLSKESVEAHFLLILDEAERCAAASGRSEHAAPPVHEMSDEERDEALRFLRSPGLVEEILHDMEMQGYVGEDSNKLLAYLIGISRKLDKPLSGIISSSSGAGKSHLAELVESLTPPEDVILFSRLSPQALGYMEKDFLRRKLLIIEERKGSESADYSIRTLQSRHKLTQGVVIKDPASGRMYTKTYTVEGPIAYLETTTDGMVNPENSTRCFELSLDESKEQTRKVQDQQKSDRTLDGLSRHDRSHQIVKKHQNAQRLLAGLKVVIPYAPLIEFPSEWLRTRRDNERFLCLIEAICFLRQHQREVKQSCENSESGEPVLYIEATVEDYRLAYELAKDVLSHTLHDLGRHSREMLDEIIRMAEERAATSNREPHEMVFSRRELREFTCWSDWKVRECLSQLVDLEYLRVLSGSQGKMCVYQVSDLASDPERSSQGFTSPEELEEKLRCSNMK